MNLKQLEERLNSFNQKYLTESSSSMSTVTKYVTVSIDHSTSESPNVSDLSFSARYETNRIKSFQDKLRSISTPTMDTLMSGYFFHLVSVVLVSLFLVSLTIFILDLINGPQDIDIRAESTRSQVSSSGHEKTRSQLNNGDNNTECGGYNFAGKVNETVGTKNGVVVNVSDYSLRKQSTNLDSNELDYVDFWDEDYTVSERSVNRIHHRLFGHSSIELSNSKENLRSKAKKVHHANNETFNSSDVFIETPVKCKPKPLGTRSFDERAETSRTKANRSSLIFPIFIADSNGEEEFFMNFQHEHRLSRKMQFLIQNMVEPIDYFNYHELVTIDWAKFNEEEFSEERFKGDLNVLDEGTISIFRFLVSNEYNGDAIGLKKYIALINEKVDFFIEKVLESFNYSLFTLIRDILTFGDKINLAQLKKIFEMIGLGDTDLENIEIINNIIIIVNAIDSKSMFLFFQLEFLEYPNFSEPRKLSHLKILKYYIAFNKEKLLNDINLVIVITSQFSKMVQVIINSHSPKELAELIDTYLLFNSFLSKINIPPSLGLNILDNLVLVHEKLKVKTTSHLPAPEFKIDSIDKLD
ncbi:hypothetical protein CLIB1444_01S15676 [[Candida] jaroonii]|uniref:Uncharacterized protein n=1 Tax=[Candida] jaroonii TaxID=467808 RepID=A0ACA9Y2J8_9ASCO|nr:hypothetical protein CLIB1444_01S15676 [[Candida] jaroonii]